MLDALPSANVFAALLVFARVGRVGPGIYVTRTAANTRRWSSAKPTRLTTSPKDRNPSVQGETILVERG